jgi:hypothetical protein
VGVEGGLGRKADFPERPVRDFDPADLFTVIAALALITGAVRCSSQENPDLQERWRIAVVST